MKHYSKLKETKISSQTLYKGVLDVKLDEVKLLNGKASTRIYLKHRGASGILPVEGEDVYLVEQFRYPIGKATLEIPAGKREPGQSFLACARAELKQETGLRARSFTEILVFHPCNAFSNEVQHLYVATGLSHGKTHLDADEFINVRKIPLKKAYSLIKNGQITDAKTILSLQWYRLNHGVCLTKKSS